MGRTPSDTPTTRAPTRASKNEKKNEKKRGQGRDKGITILSYNRVGATATQSAWRMPLPLAKIGEQ